MQFGQFLLLCVLVNTLISNVNAAEVSDEAIKKMKIKQLKEFLTLRGVVCKDCVEKNDFVKKALEAKNIPVSGASIQPVDVKSDPIWEQWRDIGLALCEKQLSDDKKAEGYCKSLSIVVESLVMRYAKKYHKDLSVAPMKLTKVSMTHPYKTAGEVHIKKAIKWMDSHNTKSQGKITEQLETPLSHWLRDCSIQNINTMLEAISDEL